MFWISKCLSHRLGNSHHRASIPNYINVQKAIVSKHCLIILSSCVRAHASNRERCVCLCVCVCVCKHACMCVCVCVCECMYLTIFHLRNTIPPSNQN